MMMIISPFDQLGLWAPSSGMRDVCTSTAYVFTYLPRHDLSRDILVYKGRMSAYADAYI